MTLYHLFRETFKWTRSKRLKLWLETVTDYACPVEYVLKLSKNVYCRDLSHIGGIKCDFS